MDRSNALTENVPDRAAGCVRICFAIE